MYIHVSFLIFPLFEKNQCFHYIACLLLLLFWYFWLFLICQIFSLMYLKTLQNQIYGINTTLINSSLNLNLCVLYTFMIMYIKCCEKMFPVKFVFDTHILSKEENRRVFEIWLFWTALIVIWTVSNGHHWQLYPHIP